MHKLGMRGRKWEIFESAVYLFASKGYENVSMRELAAENGMRAASLYTHFESKERLLELMYEFYQENGFAAQPVLQTLLDMLPESRPHEVLNKCMAYYAAELQPIMDRIYAIAFNQSNRDARAFELIWKISFEGSSATISTVLKELIGMNKIEPMDVEAFAEIYASFCLVATLRNPLPNSIGMERWLKGLDMLYSTVKVIPDADIEPEMQPS